MKSAVINYLHTSGGAGRPVDKADVAASFQAAVTDVLVQKAGAIQATGMSDIRLAGGVSANKPCRKLAAAAEKVGARLVPDAHPLHG